jgi:hypothetical protein
VKDPLTGSNPQLAREGRSICWLETGCRTAHTLGDDMDRKTRLLIAGAGIAGLSALTQLLFVITKLPVLFWSDLLGGMAAAIVTAIFLVLLRGRLRRSA